MKKNDSWLKFLFLFEVPTFRHCSIASNLNFVDVYSLHRDFKHFRFSEVPSRLLKERFTHSGLLDSEFPKPRPNRHLHHDGNFLLIYSPLRGPPRGKALGALRPFKEQGRSSLFSEWKVTFWRHTCVAEEC